MLCSYLSQRLSWFMLFMVRTNSFRIDSCSLLLTVLPFDAIQSESLMMSLNKLYINNAPDLYRKHLVQILTGTLALAYFWFVSALPDSSSIMLHLLLPNLFKFVICCCFFHCGLYNDALLSAETCGVGWRNVRCKWQDGHVFCLCPQIQSLRNELRCVRELRDSLRRQVNNTDS